MLGCKNFHGFIFLGHFSRISDGHPYPFYSRVLPRGASSTDATKEDMLEARECDLVGL